MEELKELNSLKDIVNKRFDLFLDKVAFIEKEPNRKEFTNITYKEVRDKINGLGTYLLNDLNLKGEKIAVIGENSSRWYISYMAIVCGVGIVVPIDKGLPENEIVNLINRSGAKAIIYSSRRSGEITNVRKDLSNDIIYIDMNKKESNNEALSFDRIVEKGLDEINTGDESYINVPIDNEAFSILLFTSGTSDKSKGVMLSHKNLCSNVYSCSCVVPQFGDYTCMSVLPLHHTYEFTLDYLFMTAAGGTIGICQGLKYFSKDIKIIKPDFILAVPAFIERINKVIEKGIKDSGKENVIKTIKKFANGMSKFGIDFRRKVFNKIHENFGGNLKYLFCGAAPLDLELITKMEGYGFKFLQGYGLTETAPIAALTPEADPRVGSVGKAVTCAELKIQNPNENGEGEVLIKSSTLMLGYYEMEEETNKVIKDGWFNSGDIGYLDKDGYLYITGRSKNVIVTANGKNIYPEEIELVLGKIPYISECMVYGKGDKDDLTVSVKVIPNYEYIKENLKKDMSEEEIYNLIWDEIKKVNKTLTSYKAIKYLEIKKDEFEKTTTMKIKRFAELKKDEEKNKEAKKEDNKETETKKSKKDTVKKKK